MAQKVGKVGHFPKLEHFLLSFQKVGTVGQLKSLLLYYFMIFVGSYRLWISI